MPDVLLCDPKKIFSTLSKKEREALCLASIAFFTRYLNLEGPDDIGHAPDQPSTTNPHAIDFHIAPLILGVLTPHAPQDDDRPELLADLNALDIRMCTGCGCTDLCGCNNGCHWIGPTTCSNCAPPPHIRLPNRHHSAARHRTRR